MLKASKDHKSDHKDQKKRQNVKTKANQSANRFRLPERVVEHGPEMHLEQTCELLVRTLGLNRVESVEWRQKNLWKNIRCYSATHLPPPEIPCALQNIAYSGQSDSAAKFVSFQAISTTPSPKSLKKLESVIICECLICNLYSFNNKHINVDACMWPEGKEFHFTITNQIPSSQLLENSH